MSNKQKLEDKLNIIYNQIDLNTECDRRLCCCKVGCPQMNYCEFVNLITFIWNNFSNEEKINLVVKSIEYFFKYEYEKWGMDSLKKPCMLLDLENKNCKVYSRRPLSCRLFGLWPEEEYEQRVAKFEKAYSKYGLKREDLPLNNQCPFVKRTNSDTTLTKSIIDELFNKLDGLDKVVGDFSSVRIRQKENYRTFHDWLLVKIFGEDGGEGKIGLSQLTTLVLAADRETMESQISIMKEVIMDNFKHQLPNIIEKL